MAHTARKGGAAAISMQRSDEAKKAALSLVEMGTTNLNVAKKCVDFLKAYADYTVKDIECMKNYMFRMLCMLAETRNRNSTYALSSFNIEGNYSDSHLTIPETIFIFHLYFFAKKGVKDLGTGPSWTSIFDGPECLDAKRKSNKCFQLHEKEMIAIMDRYGPEYTNYGRRLSPNASVSLIKRRFFRWNPLFFFAFFYHPGKECWTPYLGVVGEIRRRRAMRELWKRALKQSRE